MSDTCIRCEDADSAPGKLALRCSDCIEEIANDDTTIQ